MNWILCRSCFQQGRSPKLLSGFQSFHAKLWKEYQSKQCLGCLAAEKIYVAGYSWWSYCLWGIIAWKHQSEAGRCSWNTDCWTTCNTNGVLISFAVGEHQMRPSGTCYHLNYHCTSHGRLVWNLLSWNIANFEKFKQKRMHKY